MATMTPYARGLLAQEEEPRGILSGLGQGGILSGLRNLRNRERGTRPVLDFLGDRASALLSGGLGVLMAPTKRAAHEAWMRGTEGGRQSDYARSQQRREDEKLARQEQALATVLEKMDLPESYAQLPSLAQAAILQELSPKDYWEDATVAGMPGQRNRRTNEFDPFPSQAGSRPTPYTDPAKLRADLDAGFISPEQYQEGLAGIGGPERPKPSDLLAARKELAGLPGTSRFRESLPVFASMVSSVEDNSAMSDLDFVYGLAQIYDPDSVVREAEMGFVIQGQSIPSYIVGLVQKYATGQGQISAEGRRAIVQAVRRRVEQYRQQAEREAQDYTDIATRWGWNPRDVVRPLDAMPPPLGLDAGEAIESIERVP